MTYSTAAALLAQFSTMLLSRLYCTTVAPKVRVMACLGRFVSQTRGGITLCDYAQSGAAMSHETCSPAPNSMSYGLKFYRSVRDAIAHLVIGRTSVTFNFIQSYGDFLCSYKLQVALTSLLFFLDKCTTNGPLRTGHKHFVSIFSVSDRL